MSETAPKAAAKHKTPLEAVAVASQPESAPVVALKAVPKALHPKHFSQASEFVIPVNHVELPAGHTLDDCLNPAYWAHVARDMQAKGRILVDAQDGSFSAQLKVHSASDLAAVVSVEWQAQPGTKERALGQVDLYRVHHAGTLAKWRVSRNSDNATISEGWETKQIAESELLGYLKALAA